MFRAAHALCQSNSHDISPEIDSVELIAAVSERLFKLGVTYRVKDGPPRSMHLQSLSADTMAAASAAFFEVLLVILLHAVVTPRCWISLKLLRVCRCTVAALSLPILSLALQSPEVCDAYFAVRPVASSRRPKRPPFACTPWSSRTGGTPLQPGPALCPSPRGPQSGTL